MDQKVRFAPSPTGYLHEGHLLSALYVWAAAQKWHLKIHLRIEDHDQSRARPEYIQSIYQDLERFGFQWDSTSIQSERHPIYKAALNKLEEQHLVYPCFCSRKQLEAENPKSETGEIIYQGKCHTRFNTQSKSIDEPHNLRVIIPDKVIHWHDELLGDFDENPKLQCGDFPIIDRDNQWTYQFAVCVDDMDEGITHIVRGEDIRSSTARQIALMQLLGQKERPIYLHHPLIVDPNGKKLSKREKAHSLRQDLESGISTEELLGKVCFEARLQPNRQPIPLNEAISMVCNNLISI
ncbi:MAG: glutamate--tRNA ligase family protein [Fibrobacter sp.]|nr:glutamate--tRNA ligase family protein [Fibrobacter sp.]